MTSESEKVLNEAIGKSTLDVQKPPFEVWKEKVIQYAKGILHAIWKNYMSL